VKIIQECLGCGDEFFGVGEYCDVCAALVKPKKVNREPPRFPKEESSNTKRDKRKRFSNQLIGV